MPEAPKLPVVAAAVRLAPLREARGGSMQLKTSPVVAEHVRPAPREGARRREPTPRVHLEQHPPQRISCQFFQQFIPWKLRPRKFPKDAPMARCRAQILSS